MNLQKELYEARTYHINLHVEYTQLKNTYERLVNVTEVEWQAVENSGIAEPVSKVISKFWEDIEFITTAFFDIMELLNRKDYLEKSILTIWKSQLVQFRDKDPTPQPEDVPLSSDDGITVVPGYLEYLNSQLVELKGRIKWVEYNLMKYKFAASHGTELRSIIDNVLKGSKKHSRWQMFSRSSSRHKKLEEEVEWYRKRRKFFREDLQRIKSVQEAIFLKYVTPEDQKRFPSRTLTLENALKGIPTNYPGSWIETSTHSGMSMNPSLQINPSVQTNPSHSNGALPWTGSLPGASHQLSGTACVVSEDTQLSHKVASGTSPHQQSGRCRASSNYGTTSEASTAQLPADSKQSYSRVDSAMVRNSSEPHFDRCPGDNSKTDMNTTLSAQDFVYCGKFAESSIIEDSTQSNECGVEAQKPKSEVVKPPPNPFEDDDLGEESSHKISKMRTLPKLDTPSTSVPQPRNIDEPSTRSSSYESADSCAEARPQKTAATRMSQDSRISRYSSVNALGPGLYLPCSIPYSGDVGGFPTSPIAYPHFGYGMFPQPYQPERSILKKITSFLHTKNK